MNNKKCIIIFSLLLGICVTGRPAEQKVSTPINLILDTDLALDYDDVGAMAVMYALADSGYVNVLATISSNAHEMVIPCIEVLNNYYGYPNMAIGVSKSDDTPSFTSRHKIKWTEELPKRYLHKTAKTSDAPDALKIYRQVLSTQPDSSVVICSIGFFTNLKNLLLSPPDEFSPLNGKELIERKVKRLVAMAGKFPKGREFNIYSDISSAIVVSEQWPTEIIFSGYEIGTEILTGKVLTNTDEITNNPVKYVYELCFAEGDPQGRKSFDQTAVYIAIKGYAPYWEVIRGHIIVHKDGSNTWENSLVGKHMYLVKKKAPLEISKMIEKYMMYSPN